MKNLTPYQKKHIDVLTKKHWIFGEHKTLAWTKYSAKHRLNGEVIMHESLNGLIAAVHKFNKQQEY